LVHSSGAGHFEKLKLADLMKSENILFGNLKQPVVHFSAYSEVNGDLETGILSDSIALGHKNQNALSFIGDESCTCAGHWFIRHGTLDDIFQLLFLWTW